MDGNQDKKEKIPDNVAHYKVVIPSLCDYFWAIVVLILEEYYQDPENFKIVIFGEEGTPATILSLLEALRLNTEVLHLSGGDTPARLIQRGNDLVAFKNAKSAILVCETWITTISTDIPCTQAIEAGIPVSHPYETPKRMRELQEACESTGKIGRFMTITTPGEIERKGLSNFQEKGIKKATDYHIDFSENANLFRQRFNQVIMEAFRNVPIHTRRQYYLTKVRRHRFDLANQTERSVALLKDLHRCAVMMVLPNGTILEADKKILVNSKVGAGWLLDGQTSSEYEDVGIEEAMRVLHIMTAGGPSMPAKVKAEVVDLTGETSGDEVIDLTMED